MKNEFKVKKYKDATVYTLESATSGGTSAGSVASVSNAMGGVRRRSDNLIAQEEKKEAPKPRNFVAKNAKMGGAGQHKDKKKAEKQGDVKHKKPFMEDHEVSMASNELKSIHANAKKLLALVQQYGERGDLEAWQQSKITKAADYLNSVLQSIGGEHDALGETPADQNDMEEAAPALVRGAAGLAAGGIAAAGTPALVGILGPILGIGMGAAGAYNASKFAMAGADKIWDWAVKKLGGDGEAAEFVKAHMKAAARGEDTFEFNGSTFKTTLKSTEIPKAAKAVKQVAEQRAIEQNLLEDWQKVNRRDKTDGMSRKAVKAYRRENPGSKLKTAVTTKPSKLKKGGKAAKRRKSFCARMKGMKKAHAGAKTKRNPDSPINKALRRWNCEEDAYMNSLNAQVLEKLNPQAPVDTWVQDFQKADPNKYKQFKNKTPQKKAQMAAAAHYAANEPSKKK